MMFTNLSLLEVNVDTNENHEDASATEERAPSKVERNWAMGCHLAGLCGVVVPLPAAGLIGALVLWLVKREDGAFIDDQGKEALNFQISLLIYVAACFLLMLALGIGLLLLPIVGLFGFVSIIIAAIKANEGIAFRYPACIRFVK